jgi:hypothetical protein
MTDLGRSCLSLASRAIEKVRRPVLNANGPHAQTVGLANLSDAGQWLNPQYPDGLPANEEGLRRPFCDAILLTYYLVIAAILPIGKLDLAHPKKILEVNLQRFPNGAFWLWFAGRLKVMQAECEEAVVRCFSGHSVRMARRSSCRSCTRSRFCHSRNTCRCAVSAACSWAANA